MSSLKFILIVYVLYVNGNILTYNHDGIELIRKCIESIMWKSFDDTPILYICDDQMGDYIPILNDWRQLTYNFNVINEWNESYYYVNHVIMGKTYRSIREMYDKYLNTSLYNKKYTGKGRAIIYTLDNDEDNLELTIKHFWSNYFSNLLLINDTGGIHYVNPYWKETFCGSIVSYKYQGTCNRVDDIDKVIWETYPRNLTNCTLNAITFGLHIKMPYLDDTNLESSTTGILNQPIRSLIKRYNLRVNYIVANEHDQNTYPQIGTPYLLKELYDSKIYDLIVVEPFRLPHTNYYYESSQIIFFERKVWISPRPRQLSKITVLTRLFEINLWICWLIVLILVTILTWFIMRTKFIDTFMQIYSIAIGTSILLIPVTYSAKLLIMFYMIYAFHIIYFFQGQLSSLLTSPAYELPINSFERLAKSNLTIVFYYKLNRDTFRNSLNSYVQSMNNRTILLYTDTYDPAEYVLTHDNYTSSAFAHNSNITEAHKKQVRLVIEPKKKAYLMISVFFIVIVILARIFCG